LLSIAKISGTGQGDYYLNLASEDYYLKGGEPPGKWHGEGAKELGLRGEVKAKDFRNVLGGYSADGKEKLVQNAGEEGRQSSWV
jgi:conjugative relaxase-like TrwC/TraI family protein